MIRSVVFCCTLLFLNTQHPVFAAALNLPRDAAGWTVFNPSADTRIMYVSAGGDSATAVVYTSANHPDWENPQNPSGTIKSFATFAAAYANVRQGYPDWVLVKRGDTLYDMVGVVQKSGRSASEPMLIGAYGNSGLSPLFKPPYGGLGYGVSIVPGSGYSYTQRFVAVQGVRFYAYTRNPDDPGYVGNDGTNLLDIYGRYVSNILIEGCSFSYAKNNRVSSVAGYGTADDIDLRRNIFAYSYAEDGHASGLGGGGTLNLLLEENIFYHNGWLVQNYGEANDRTDGQATMLNHSTYFGGDKNSIFRNNISISPSSIHFKHAIAAGPVSVENLLHDNNLLIDGEVGVDAAGNGPDLGVGVQNFTFSNNVLYKIGLSNPTRRGISWAITTANVGTGGADIYKNLVLNKDLPGNLSDVGIILGIDSTGTYTTLHNTKVRDNVFVASSGPWMAIWIKKTGESSRIENNYFFMQENNNRVLYSELPEGATTAYSFAGNRYFKSEGEKLYKTSPTTEYTGSQWQSRFEPTALFTEKMFPDDTRSVETYMTSVGETGTLDAFIGKCRAQDRFNWDTRFTANTVNDYIRAGFDMGQRRLFRNVRVGEVEP